MNVHRLFRPGAKRFTIRREARRLRPSEIPIAGAKDVDAPAEFVQDVDAPADVEVMAEVEQLNEQRKGATS